MNNFKEIENINNFNEVYEHIDGNAALLIHNDGESDLVVMSSIAFDEFVTAMKVNAGFQEIDNGLFLEHEQVKANFELKYGKFE
jgi:hypothetical protein